MVVSIIFTPCPFTDLCPTVFRCTTHRIINIIASYVFFVFGPYLNYCFVVSALATISSCPNISHTLVILLYYCDAFRYRMTLLFIIYTAHECLSSFSPSGDLLSSLGLKKCLDTILFVQGLEVVIPYQHHSSQLAVAKQINVSLTSDMFLVWGQGIGVKRI